MQYDVIVVGGGASGMMAAIAAGQAGAKTLLLEKMEQTGRKVRITGKGRCNVTNMKPWVEFQKHVHPLSRFVKSAFYSFSNEDLLKLLANEGVETVVERGDRVYPTSYNALDVVLALRGRLAKLGVETLLNSNVVSVNCSGNHIEGITLQSGKVLYCKTLVLSTGGLSYPLTGSTGDGYNFAKAMGHTIKPLRPSLCSLMPRNYNKLLMGINLKNVALTVFADGSPIAEEMGELYFTELGMEGPIVLRTSREAVRALDSGRSVVCRLNLKPALERQQLIDRLENENKQTKFSVLLRSYLPQMLITPFASAFGIELNSSLSVWPKGVERIAQALMEWDFKIASHGDYNRAVVTMGGVSLSEVNQKSMGSKLIDNLFFSGEVLDIDSDTGGYNLQVAFSTGYLAGDSAAQLVGKLSAKS